VVDVKGTAVEGAALYTCYGCINCHGPNGLGGVPNPQAPDRTIPPLSGASFRTQFNTDAKIIAVIRSDSVIGRAPIVSHQRRLSTTGDPYVTAFIHPVYSVQIRNTGYCSAICSNCSSEACRSTRK